MYYVYVIQSKAVLISNGVNKNEEEKLGVTINA